MSALMNFYFVEEYFSKFSIFISISSVQSQGLWQCFFTPTTDAKKKT